MQYIKKVIKLNYLYDKSYVIAGQQSPQDRIMMEKLFQAVEQMINDLVPIMIEKYLIENQENVLLKIETMINGHSVSSQAIMDSIQKELVNQLKF